MRHVLVTGGTGVLGSTVVRELLARGHQVRVLSRRVSPPLPEGATAVRGDLGTGDGLRAALTDIDTVVHCASHPRRHAEVDVEGTRRLVTEMAGAGGEAHLIFVSIVGCDRISSRYLRSKTLAELAVAESGLPWTVLRTTQFHDLIFALSYAASRLPVVPMPRAVRSQPIDVHDVAPRLVELVESGAAGRVADLGGPEILTMQESVRMVERATDRERPVLSLPFAGRTYAALAKGRNLAPDHRKGRRTFSEYVAEHVHRGPGEQTRVDLPYKWRS